MSITSHKLVESSTQADGRIRLRYEFTDHLGITHPIGPKTVPVGFDDLADRESMVAAVEAQLVQQDINNSIQIIMDGEILRRESTNEDVRAITAQYATQAQIEAAIFSWFMTTPLDARMAVPLVDAVTDAELTAFGLDAAGIAAVRARANDLRQLNALITAEEVNYNG